MPDARDERLNLFLAHGAIMPPMVASGKPPESVYSKISSYATSLGMSDADKPYLDIAERIRWHRALLDVNQSEYAAKAGLKRTQLSNWETGYKRISLDAARALRKTYGLSLDFIFEGIPDALPMTLMNAWRDKPSDK
jgi:DNA-binding XRE family transcriptional regulator